MIILDEPYSNALLRQAVEDKYATPYHEGSAYTDPYLRSLLVRGLNKQLRQEVLWYLLLFNPVYLPPLFDNLTVDRLVKEELIQAYVSTSSSRMDGYRLVDERPEAVFEIRDLLLAELRAEGFREANEPDLERYVEFQRQDGRFAKVLMAREQQRNVKRMLGKDLFSPATVAFLERNEALIDRLHRLQERAVHWFTLFRWASELGFSIKAKPKGLRISSHSSATTSRATGQGSLPSKAYCAVGIWLKEVEVQPRIGSIDDVLRLRENKFFADFRQIVLRWADLVSTGEAREEEKVRKDIAKASSELKRLSQWKKVGGLITYVSLPLDVAILISGLPIVTSPIGLAVQGYVDVKSKPYQWLMFGQTVN